LQCIGSTCFFSVRQKLPGENEPIEHYACCRRKQATTSALWGDLVPTTTPPPLRRNYRQTDHPRENAQIGQVHINVTDSQPVVDGPEGDAI
jgi:hypothetical protein